MQKFSPQKCQPVFRAVLLLGVLTGLLFSCGEGIRLFPFPVAEIAGKEESRLKDGEETDYQKSVLRFEKGEGNYQSKFQRNSPQHHRANVCNVLDYSLFFASAVRNETDSPFDSHSLKSRLFSASLKSRAPPFLKSLSNTNFFEK